MSDFIKIIAFCLTLFVTTGTAYGQQGNDTMKIKLTFDNKEIIVRMNDTEPVRQFLQMLPASFEFIDFAGEEKISEFPRPVSLNEAKRGMIATAGKMFIYAPWGNFGFFYKNHGHKIDNSLIELGNVESGLEHLTDTKGGFRAKIELISEEK